MITTLESLKAQKRTLSEKIDECELVAGECFEQGNMHVYAILCESAVKLSEERDELTARIDAMEE